MTMSSTMRPFRARLVGLLAATALLPSSAHAAGPAATTRPTSSRPPNVVIFYFDDMGFADMGCFGGKTPTPNIDRIAREGVRLTNYYAAQPTCTASRASLMTGCYPNRIGMSGAIGPRSRIGLAAEELTLPEMLRRHGYATGMVGKWHLGDAPQFMPLNRGFEDFFGIPYSSDMSPGHPEGYTYPKLPLYDGDKIIDADLTGDNKLSKLPARLVQRSVTFIEQHKEKPFLFYFATPFPHVPLAVGDAFVNKTGLGKYADVIAELDDSVGQVRNALDKAGVLDHTLLILASDNGPWRRYGNHAGSAGPYREGKGNTFDGGVHLPFIARLPELIPAGTVQSEPAMSIDLLPTIAALTGATGPKLPIDGKDIRPLLACESGAKTPHDAFYFYYNNNDLEGVRMGQWKLLLPHVAYQVVEGRPVGHDGIPTPAQKEDVPLSLYDLSTDIGEGHNLALERPEIVEQIMTYVSKARADMGDDLTKSKGSGRRAPGRASAVARPSTLP